MRKRFKVLFEWDEETGVYSATVPALPGCVTQGNNLHETVERVREAITGYLEALQLQGESLPKEPEMLFGEVEVSV
jgi:antitoxin HicB